MKKKTSHSKSKKSEKAKPLKDVNEPPASLKEEKKPRGKEKVHYVNSKEFEDEIRNFYKSDFISIKLGDSINKIAHGLSYAPNFINYSYKDDMIGDAIVKMVSALKNKKFRLDSGFSPFSYFTTIAFHAFINRIKKEKKHHETVTNYRDRVYTDLMTTHDADAGYHIYVDPNSSEESDNYNATGS
jgi:pterin-4a-carbinolamine dehydratase